VNQKNERPVGAPAARAWGMEGTCNPKKLGPSGRFAALASGKPNPGDSFSSHGPDHFRLRPQFAFGL